MDENRPNQNANKEPAEGSRETVVANQAAQGQGADAGENAGGITNRPLDREQQEQDEVPARGQSKDEERNA